MTPNFRELPPRQSARGKQLVQRRDPRPQSPRLHGWDRYQLLELAAQSGNSGAHVGQRVQEAGLDPKKNRRSERRQKPPEPPRIPARQRANKNRKDPYDAASITAAQDSTE